MHKVLCMPKYLYLMKKLNYSFKHLIIYLSVAFLAFTVTYYEILDTSKIRNIFSKADQYQPNYSKQHITEYAFIYVGSSKCTYSNDEQIYGAIMQIKNELSNRAKKEKIGFHTVGIASELNAESGIEHLRNFGNFNEKIVGAGWNNVGVNRFVYRYSQDYATPSIIILKEHILINHLVKSRQKNYSTQLVAKFESLIG